MERILFIVPNFMGYDCAIKKALEKRGYIVDKYDDRPSNSFYAKAIIRVYKKMYYIYINNYYNEIKEKIKNNKYDIFLAVAIEAIPIWFIKKIRENNKNAYFVYYSWDSIFNKKGTNKFLPYFDKTFSFDRRDCENNSNINFRPLFYLNEYYKIRHAKDFKYDLCIIGTAHSDRYSIIRKIINNIKDQNMSYFSYLYLNSRKLYFWLKITNSNFKHASISEFHYTTLKLSEIIYYISCSRIIIDIQHPKQTGLTMRTIEMLGARRKLITTNADIKMYDFYNPDNICIIDRNNPKIDIDFINKEYVDPDNSILYKYSIDGWLDDILNI